MEQNREIVIFLGAATAVAILLRLAFGPIPVAGLETIYATVNAPPAAQLAVRDSDRAVFPD